MISTYYLDKRRHLRHLKLSLELGEERGYTAPYFVIYKENSLTGYDAERFFTDHTNPQDTEPPLH
jgi:hypothetical protein